MKIYKFTKGELKLKKEKLVDGSICYVAYEKDQSAIAPMYYDSKFKCTNICFKSVDEAVERYKLDKSLGHFISIIDNN